MISFKKPLWNSSVIIKTSLITCARRLLTKVEAEEKDPTAPAHLAYLPSHRTIHENTNEGGAKRGTPTVTDTAEDIVITRTTRLEEEDISSECIVITTMRITIQTPLNSLILIMRGVTTLLAQVVTPSVEDMNVIEIAGTQGIGTTRTVTTANPGDEDMEGQQTPPGAEENITTIILPILQTLVSIFQTVIVS
jgi:hypothetical protein